MEVASGKQLLAAGGLGTAQGVANTANGVQDGVIGTVNLIPMALNKVEGNHLQNIPSPDWSRDLIVHESDGVHEASEFLGGTGVMTLATAGLGQEASAAGSGVRGAQTIRMVVQANGQLAATTSGTAVTATQAGAVGGMAIGSIGQTVQMSAGNPVPGSTGAGSGGNAPTAGGGKKLVRYGSPDTVEKLAADAAKAESSIGYHGVSAMLRNPPSFPHGQAEFGEAAKFFQIIKTGTNPSHYTVILPKPVTQEVADLFNSIFRSTGS